jgi:hypothetical protein
MKSGPCPLYQKKIVFSFTASYFLMYMTKKKHPLDLYWKEVPNGVFVACKYYSP